MLMTAPLLAVSFLSYSSLFVKNGVICGSNCKDINRETDVKGAEETAYYGTA